MLYTRRDINRITSITTVFIRNYFLIFAVAWLLLIVGKMLFLWSFGAQFVEFSLQERVYAIAWGYRFDLAVSAMAALLATLFDWHAKTMRIAAGLLLTSMIVLVLADMLYFQNSGRHVGYEILDTFNDAHSLFLNAWGQQKLITLLMLIGFPLLVLGFYKLPGGWLEPIDLNRFYLPKKILLVLMSAFFIRGLLAPIPLTPWQAIDIGDEKLAAIAMNGSYSALYSLLNGGGKLHQRFFSEQDNHKTAQALVALYADKPQRVVAQGDVNIVFLLLESWNANNMQPYGYTAQTTPYFDSLLQRSLRPKAGIADGIRTTEGMFAILTSFQNPLGASVAKSQLQDQSYQTIINVLTERGYSSAFFQGTAKETSGTGAFALKLGFAQSYGKDDVIERQYETNDWGVYDQDLYRFVLSKVKQLKPPFVVGINGATTHDDKLPAGLLMQRFSENEARNKRLNALHFSDQALESFVGEMQKNYPNTIFVLMADHSNWVVGSRFEHFLIPFAIYGSGIKPQYIDAFVSQRDVAPTIADIVFGQYEQLLPNASGKSLFSNQRFFADYYHNGVLGWVEDQAAIEYIPQTDHLACYDVSNYTPKNVSCEAVHEQLKNHAISFAGVSQDLLFQGKVSEFHLYRGQR